MSNIVSPTLYLYRHKRLGFYVRAFLYNPLQIIDYREYLDKWFEGFAIPCNYSVWFGFLGGYFGTRRQWDTETFKEQFILDVYNFYE